MDGPTKTPRPHLQVLSGEGNGAQSAKPKPDLRAVPDGRAPPSAGQPQKTPKQNKPQSSSRPKPDLHAVPDEYVPSPAWQLRWKSFTINVKASPAKISSVVARVKGLIDLAKGKNVIPLKSESRRTRFQKLLRFVKILNPIAAKKFRPPASPAPLKVFTNQNLTAAPNESVSPGPTEPPRGSGPTKALAEGASRLFHFKNGWVVEPQGNVLAKKEVKLNAFNARSRRKRINPTRRIRSRRLSNLSLNRRLARKPWSQRAQSRRPQG